jgi:hypothetical protein
MFEHTLKPGTTSRTPSRRACIAAQSRHQPTATEVFFEVGVVFSGCLALALGLSTAVALLGY